MPAPNISFPEFDMVRQAIVDGARTDTRKYKSALNPYLIAAIIPTEKDKRTRIVLGGGAEFVVDGSYLDVKQKIDAYMNETY